MKHITYFALLVSLKLAASLPAKTNARPVIEVNEQARIDDKAGQSNFPYVNPLAGNSKQNAKIHAQNQQAMFNAERVRQHRAQLQRWTKAPQQEDSYMKAYHESQENHQLALEQQEAKLRDDKAVTIAPKLRQAPQRVRKQKIVINDSTKITKDDAVAKPERVRSRGQSRTGVRNHRSYGSVEYHQHLQPKRYQTVYVSPGPTYDQGVTIKPNGNVGLATMKHQNEETRLYTEAIPSKTQHVYPKQYSQMQSYQSAYDIDMLSSLLKKNPTDQLTELNSLLEKDHGDSAKETLTTPIDLFFYLKDNPSQMLPESYDQHDYAQIAHHYANAYAHDTKDHTPITEEVDDIEDPYKNKPKPYTPQLVPTQAPEEEEETTTTKNNNYYKVEVASQVISAPYNAKASYYHKGEEKPSYQSLQYQPYNSYSNDHKLEGDHSERYLHHNAQHSGIQHLSEDGTGVSAYGDENVSIVCDDDDDCNKIRKPRSALETDPFYVPSPNNPLTESPMAITAPKPNNNTAPESDKLVRFGYFGKNHRKNEHGTFLTTPNFPVGVASEFLGYDSDYDDSSGISYRKPNRLNKYDIYDEEDDEEEYSDEDDYDNDYDNRPFNDNRYNQYDNRFNAPSLYNDRPFQNYAPASGYNQNVDQKGSSTKKFRQFNGYNQGFNFEQNFNSGFDYPQYSVQNSYGNQDSYFPSPSVPTFGEPPVYGPPKPANPIVPIRYGAPIQNNHGVIEPIYMLTQSQLKDLIGDHNVNIQHYDLINLPKHKKKHKPRYHPRKYPRKSKKRPRGRGRPGQRNFSKHVGRLHKIRYL